MYPSATNWKYPAVKAKLNPGKIRGFLPHLVLVRFEFIHHTAATVCVAGTFNHWQPQTKPLHASCNGHWWKEAALAPGTYEYCLVVDGEWIPDPLASATVPNPFGGLNSILKVAGLAEAAR